LREGLRDHPAEALALKLMSDNGMDHANEAQESASELRSLMNRMLVDHLKIQETQAIEASKSDPSELLRYRELQARRRQLEAVTPSP
jgi:DNA primase